VILFLSVRVLRLDAYAMMDAANLRRLTFFARVGAFGVDLDDPFDGARAVRYAAKLLNAPGRLVWIFPQGREVPVTARPLGFKRGSAEIARVAKGAAVIPAAIRYEHGKAPRPTIYVSFGSPIASGRELDQATTAQEEAVTRQLDAIDTLLIAGEQGDLVELHRARSNPLQGVAERALSFITRLP
jgi:1-acyl-sn-glycerol-3-phosphate acyltransferase